MWVACFIWLQVGLDCKRFETPSEYARRPKNQALEVYFGDHHVGLYRLRQDFDGSVIHVEETMSMAFRDDNGLSDYVMCKYLVFDGGAPYRLLQATTLVNNGPFFEMRELTRISSREYQLTITRAGEEETTLVEPLDITLADEQWAELWSISQPRDQERIRVRTYDFMNSSEVVKLAQASVSQTSPDYQLTTVRIVGDESLESYTFDSNGILVEVSVGDFKARKPSSRTTSATFGLPADLMSGYSLDRPLNDIESIESLVMEMPASLAASVTDTENQKVEVDSQGTPLLHISVKGFARPAQRHAKVEVTRRDDEAVEPDLKDMALAAIGDAVDTRDKVARLLQFVSTYLTYDTEQKFEAFNVGDIIATKKGDCSQFSQLFESLADAIDIPAETLTGYVYSQEKNRFAGHAWCRARINEEWLQVDPTAGTFVDAPIYIELDDQLPPRLMTNDSLKLVRVKRRGEKNFEIGNYGSRANLANHWSRRQISENLGDSQFSSSHSVYLAFLEHVTHNASKLSDLIENMASSFKARATVSNIRHEPIEDLRGMRHLVTKLHARVGSLEFAYSIRVIEKSGLAYILLGWTQLSQEEVLNRELDEVVLGFQFPDKGSKWHELNKVEWHRFKHQGVVFSFPYLPGRFEIEHSTDSDAIAIVTSRETEDIGRMFWVQSDETPMEFETKLFGYLGDQIELTKRIGQEHVEVGPYQGLIAAYETPDYHYESLVLKVDENILEFRTTYDPDESDNHFFHDLFTKLEISVPEKLVAFPANGSKQHKTNHTEREQALLAESESLGSFDDRVYRITFVGQQIVSYSHTTAQIFNMDSSELSTIFESDTWQQHDMVVTARGLWLLRADQAPLGLLGGTVATDGSLAIELGDKRSMLIHYLDAGVSFKGYQNEAFGYQNQPPLRVSIVGKRKRYNHILQSPEYLVFSEDGRFILVIAQSGNGYDVQILDTKNLTPLAASKWTSIRGFSASKNGWLISGGSSQGQQGIFLCDNHLLPQLLLSGRFMIGAHYDSDSGLIAVESDNGNVWRIPHAVLKSAGRTLQPFYGNLLNDIATQALERTRLTWQDLGSWDAIQAFTSASDQIAMELVGRELPQNTRAFDQLLGDITYNQGLSFHAMLLLACQMSQIMVNQGASWLDGDVLGLSTASIQDQSSRFSAYSPFRMVWSTLYDEEGWWNPASVLVDELSSHPVYLSYDRERLLAIEKEWEKSVFDICATRDLNTLIALIDSQPNNAELRQSIYSSLNSPDNLELLGKLVIHVGKTIRPLGISDNLLLSHFAFDMGAVDHAIQILWDAIKTEPDEPSLYAQLGWIYENSKRARAFDLARASYLKALELENFNEALITYLESRLAALDQAPAQPPSSP